MATLTVLKFNSAEGADQALSRLIELQKQELIKLQDAAVVSWPAGKKRPTTRQAANLAAAGALNGAFWGLLFGLLFFIPLFGMAIGAGMGALTGAFSDFGINDAFIKDVREQVTEGTSALFTLSNDAVVDRVVPELKSLQPEVIASNLSAEQEAKLKELFVA
jgi:uncharacterized membrane protein